MKQVISKGGIIMDIAKLYSESKCPHCGKYCISYRQKMNLIDYRYSYTCKECGGTIELPMWHILLYLSEIILMILLMVKLHLNTWQIIIGALLTYLFISFIQLPFIPIRD